MLSCSQENVGKELKTIKEPSGKKNCERQVKKDFHSLSVHAPSHAVHSLSVSMCVYSIHILLVLKNPDRHAATQSTVLRTVLTKKEVLGPKCQ